MSGKIIKVLVSIIGFLLFSTSFALSLDGDVKLEKSTTDSLEISFDKVDGATGYFLYYDVESREDGEYAFQGDNVSEDNKIKIENLESDTIYYIAISVVGSDYKEGSMSYEVKFKTLNNNSGENSLVLENINILNTKTIKLTFNNDLDENSFREFLIVNKDNNMEDVVILESEITQDKIVTIYLQDDIKAGGEYSITIIDLSGINGEKIEAGVDGIENFSIPLDVKDREDTDYDYIDDEYEDVRYDDDYYNSGDTNSEDNSEDNNEDSSEGTIEKDIELNSAGVEQTTQVNNVSGVSVTDEELNKNLTNAGQNSDKLPTTGPENWILLMLALIFGISYILIKKKK